MIEDDLGYEGEVRAALVTVLSQHEAPAELVERARAGGRRRRRRRRLAAGFAATAVLASAATGVGLGLAASHPSPSPAALGIGTATTPTPTASPSPVNDLDLDGIYLLRLPAGYTTGVAPTSCGGAGSPAIWAAYLPPGAAVWPASGPLPPGTLVATVRLSAAPLPSGACGPSQAEGQAMSSEHLALTHHVTRAAWVTVSIVNSGTRGAETPEDRSRLQLVLKWLLDSWATSNEYSQLHGPWWTPSATETAAPPGQG
jgi:hypothetical protein